MLLYMEKLIKLSDTHYVVVDDSPIKEGDKSLLKVDGFEPIILTHFEPVEEGYQGRKITHSTQQLEYTQMYADIKSGLYWDKVKPISLSDVEKTITYYIYKLAITEDKLFTIEDMMEAWDKSQSWREDNNTWERFILTKLPKTEWDVKFINGKLHIL
jgi:hypothetical protein